jgi:hypothetical protein
MQLITQIKYEDVTPPLNGDNWNISGTYKIEFVYKDMWTNIPPEHWSRKLANNSELNQNGIYINSDYKLYLDFIEPSYIWAKGGNISEVYQYTTIYDGNFVKAIMRINNICENLMDICKNIERFDLITKLENYNQLLIFEILIINFI